MDELLFVGYEYPSDEASQEVYDRAQRELHNCSLWRTMDPKTRRFSILGLFDHPDDALNYHWGEGTAFDPTPEQEAWMADSRLKRSLRAFSLGATSLDETLHYDDEATAPRAPGGPH